MKTCKKCGVYINENSGDLCEECIKIANGAPTTYEKVLKIMSYVLLIGGMVYSLIMIISIAMHRSHLYATKLNGEDIITAFFTIVFSIIGWAVLSLIIDLSVNIRILTNQKMKQGNNDNLQSSK